MFFLILAFKLDNFFKKSNVIKCYIINLYHNLMYFSISTCKPHVPILFFIYFFFFLDFLVKNQVIRNLGNVIENVTINRTRICNEKFVRRSLVSTILLVYYTYLIIFFI